MHQSPGLKPDWFGESKSFAMKYSDRYYILNPQKPLCKSEVEILINNSSKSVYYFSCGQEPQFAFSVH